MRVNINPLQLSTQIEAIKNNATQRMKVFDPQTIPDSLATKTDWEPMNKNFLFIDNCYLNQLNPSKLVYRPKPNLYLLRFLILCLVVIIYWVVASFFFAYTNFMVFIIAGVLSVLTFVIGYLLTNQHMVAKTFDKRTGIFFAGKNLQSEKKVDLRNMCLLKDIHAIQLLRNYLNADYLEEGRTYTGKQLFEMNLVLKNTYRINVINCSDSYQIRKDARSLAEFLNLSVWDGIQ